MPQPSCRENRYPFAVSAVRYTPCYPQFPQSFPQAKDRSPLFLSPFSQKSPTGEGLPEGDFSQESLFGLQIVFKSADLHGCRHGGIAILRRIADIARHILKISLAGDHGAVVTAQFQRRQIQLQTSLFTFPLQQTTQRGVGRHAACGTDALAPLVLCRCDHSVVPPSGKRLPPDLRCAPPAPSAGRCGSG